MSRKRRIVRRTPRSRKVNGITLLLLLVMLGAVLLQRYATPPPPAAPIPAPITAGTGEMVTRVERIIDGDTIVLVGGERVRYIGIDTPEMAPKGGGGPEPFAEKAKTANERLVGGREVRLVFDVEERDRYDRLLAYVYVGETFVNLELVERGFAVARAYPPNTRHRAEFEAAQSRAAGARRGRWAREKQP